MKYFWMGKNLFLAFSLCLALGIGYTVGILQAGAYRRDRCVTLARKLQLIALRNEMKGYRRQGRRPLLSHWQKFLLGWLHGISSTLTRYTCFRPETLVGWHRRYVRHWWNMISLAGRRRTGGRPKLDEAIAQIIPEIKANNPKYGAKRIAAILGKQLGVTVSVTTIRNVLSRRGRSPSTPTSGQGQTWKNFLNNHRDILAAMDFKVTFDWRA